MVYAKCLIGGIFLVFCLQTSAIIMDYNLTVTVTCAEDHKRWCAEVFIIDDDGWSFPEYVKRDNLCANGGENITFPFGDLTPRGEIGKLYEIYPYVSHNCTRTGKYHCYGQYKRYYINHREYSVVNLTLALPGERDINGWCKHPAKSFWGCCNQKKL